MPEEKYDKTYLLNKYPSCVCGTASIPGTHTPLSKATHAVSLEQKPSVPASAAGARGNPRSGLGISGRQRRGAEGRAEHGRQSRPLCPGGRCSLPAHAALWPRHRLQHSSTALLSRTPRPFARQLCPPLSHLARKAACQGRASPPARA